jgi:phenylalanine-4-hydroxylase
LIGTVENPKIYGAGLLVIYWRKCTTYEVKKIPYDISAAYQVLI